MACSVCSDGLSISRVGEQLERRADKHRFPMRIRPGDRPPVQWFANRPFNVELLQALRGSLGQPGGPPGFLEDSSCAGLLARRSDCGSVAISVQVYIRLNPHAEKLCPRSTSRGRAAQPQLRSLI
jgi:hypothetical protein